MEETTSHSVTSYVTANDLTLLGTEIGCNSISSEFECKVDLPLLVKETYSCPHCDFKTTCKSYLPSHIKMKHDNYAKQNSCKLCNFKSKYSLRTHMSRVHSKTKRFNCEKCPFETNYRGSLQGHMYTHVEGGENKMCSQCGKMFSATENLKRHISLYHLNEGTKFKCTFCEFEAKRKDYIKNHEKTMHLGIKSSNKRRKETLTCEYPTCHFSTDYRQNMSNHVNAIHLQNFKFTCTQCPYGCMVKASLELHVKLSHEKVRDFVCAICRKGCCTKSDLQQHVFVVHDEIKSYHCEYCPTKFSTIQKLDCHTKAVHEKLKPFVCDKCGIAFSRRANMRQHVDIVHNKIKKYVCNHCGHAFGQKGDLRKHIRVMHQDEDSNASDQVA